MSDIQNTTQRSVGVEVSKTALTAVCLDGGGQIVGTHRSDVDLTQSPVKQLIAFVAELTTGFGDFDRIGIAIPGLVAPGGRKVAYSVHVPELSGFELAEHLETASGKRIILENDANAAAYGEVHLGAGRGAGDMFFATLGIGVGGAFIIDGKIWRGAAGFAGEFGYIPINSEGVRLEEVASSANIIRRTRSRFHQDGTSSLVELDETKLTINDIVAAAEAEDDFAKLMLERTGTYVGTGIACVINLLNIERVVIGGEIVGSRHTILTSIIARARELSFRPSFDETVIAASELGVNAAAAGAALLVGEAT